MDIATDRQQKMVVQIKQALTSIPGVEIIPFCDLPQSHHWNPERHVFSHHGPGQGIPPEHLFREVESIPATMATLVETIRGELAKANVAANRYVPIPDISYGQIIAIALKIDGVPVRFLCSYAFQWAAWACTLDAYYGDSKSKTWRDEPSLL